MKKDNFTFQFHVVTEYAPITSEALQNNGGDSVKEGFWAVLEPEKYEEL